MIGFSNSSLSNLKGFDPFIRTFDFLVSNNLNLEIKSILGKEGTEIAKFARENTPEDSIFLTPPNWGQFRILAHRAIVVDFKAFLFSDREMLEWYNRIISCYGEPVNAGFSMIPELESNYKAITDEQLQQLMSKYHINYAVLYSDTITNFNVIFHNNSYKIVSLDKE